MGGAIVRSCSGLYAPIEVITYMMITYMMITYVMITYKLHCVELRRAEL